MRLGVFVCAVFNCIEPVPFIAKQPVSYPFKSKMPGLFTVNAELGEAAFVAPICKVPELTVVLPV